MFILINLIVLIRIRVNITISSNHSRKKNNLKFNYFLKLLLNTSSSHLYPSVSHSIDSLSTIVSSTMPLQIFHQKLYFLRYYPRQIR